MNMEDAVWVRDTVVPLALESGRWNAAVFEVFRAVELLLKGLMCLSGHTPRHSHEVQILVDDFAGILDALGDQPPFMFTLTTSHGVAYGLRFDGRRLELLRFHQGAYAVLGCLVQQGFNSIDRLVTLRLEVNGNLVQALSGEKLLLRAADLSATGVTQKGRTVFRAPDAKAVGAMKTCAAALRSQREDAFYGTVIYGPADAEEAVTKMNRVFDASRAFVLLR